VPSHPTLQTPFQKQIIGLPVGVYR
jgi:hypothetical protein